MENLSDRFQCPSLRNDRLAFFEVCVTAGHVPEPVRRYRDHLLVEVVDIDEAPGSDGVT